MTTKSRLRVVVLCDAEWTAAWELGHFAGAVVKLPFLLLTLVLLGACRARPPVGSPPAAVVAREGALFQEGDHLPGREDLRICKKEWSAEQCCDFLCRCLGQICGDSGKGRPGLASCGSWCPRIGDTARRCHVYHCFVSISPTGGIKDHDSHCGHAADQVPGGGCPPEVTR